MFIAPLTPIGKPRMTQKDRWAKRDCVIRYFNFCDQLRAEATRQNFTIVNGLHYLFLMPMPQSWSKKKKGLKIKTFHTQRADLDNCIKAVWDALLKDDSRIAWIASAKKVWSQRPGILISNSPIKY